MIEKALKQAIEALEWANEEINGWKNPKHDPNCTCYKCEIWRDRIAKYK